MPRISDSLTLNEVAFAATRPQNGDTPAAFREVSTSKPLQVLEMVNIGATVEKTAARHVFRAKASIIKPNAVVDGIQLSANRIDITTRLGSELTDDEIDDLSLKLVSLVSSTEFKAALRGNEQY